MPMNLRQPDENDYELDQRLVADLGILAARSLAINASEGELSAAIDLLRSIMSKGVNLSGAVALCLIAAGAGTRQIAGRVMFEQQLNQSRRS